jgi:cytochrome P450
MVGGTAHLGSGQSVRECGAIDAVTLASFEDVRAVLRARDMRQALYDDGAIVMADCLLDLHGAAHRDRRRLENRLFRRDTFAFYEESVLPAAIDEAIAPMASRGAGDLVQIGYRTVMHLTALIAGVDVAPGSEDTLEMVVKALSKGATAVHATSDRAVLLAEVEEAMTVFDEQFLRSSVERRLDQLRAVDAGVLSVDALPRDVLTTLLRNIDALDLPQDVIRREIAFYLQAGGHSTANSVTHALDDLWACAVPGVVDRARGDLRFLQRCVHESLRLHPASPVAWRRALSPYTTSSGQHIAEGALVILDLEAANRDPGIWGAAAGEFDPQRDVPDGLPPWGLSFGSGTHACIGMELDGGVLEEDSSGTELFGTVTRLASALLAAGARPDETRPAIVDPASERVHYSCYPLVFERDHAG